MAAFVDEPVVSAAEQEQVLELRLAAGGPVLDVVAVGEEPVRTAGVAAASVAESEGAAEGGRDGAFAAAVVENYPLPFACASLGGSASCP